MRPLDLLESVGWLAGDAWLAHGVHFNDDEIARLGAAGTGVSHCPSSNMTLSSGTCRALELERSGAPVGLAVDGSASNDGSNLMQECRQAFLLQRLRYGAAQVTHRDALRWATAGSARCLGRRAALQRQRRPSRGSGALRRPPREARDGGRPLGRARRPSGGHRSGCLDARASGPGASTRVLVTKPASQHDAQASNRAAPGCAINSGPTPPRFDQ